MKTFMDNGGSGLSRDPSRWADMAPEALGPAAKFLDSPPPIQALPSDVAMRVRANVLGSPAPASPLAEAKSALSRNAAPLKLSGIAVVAAFFGAGVVTAVTAVQDPGELRVVESRQPDDAIGSNAVGGAHQVPRRGELPESGANRAAVTAERMDDGHTSAMGEGPVSHPGLSARHANGMTAELRAASARRETKRPAGLNLLALEEQAVTSEQHVGAEGSSPTRRAKAQRDATQPSRRASTGNPEFGVSGESEALERPVVRPEFRRVTAARKPHPRSTLTSLEEETLLLEDARSKLGRAPDAALRLALQHQTRFRQGQLFEQRRMIHLEALLRLGRDDEAKKLAGGIGSSIYQARANALLVRYGIVTR